ncbi:MAG: LysM peptidoglycan-binding domain-containing protein [Dehalococcoidia bacterium]
MRVPLRPFGIGLLFATGMVAFVAGACGGGGDDGTQGGGTRITDPAKVASSTPIQNPLLYQIKGDTVSTSGGATATVQPGTNAGGATPTRTGAQTYKVVAGDTCSTIATKFNVSVDALLRANTRINADCSNLTVDDQLRIPSAPTTVPVVGGSATAKPSGKTYKVVSGDTCDSIARANGVDVGKLISLNGLDANCTRLQIGQTLNLP